MTHSLAKLTRGATMSSASMTEKLLNLADDTEDHNSDNHGGTHFKHSTNYIGTWVFDHDQASDFVIDIAAVKKGFADWRTFTQGYRNTFMFLTFLFLHVYMLDMQRCEPALGEVDAGLRQMVDLTKADMKVSDVDSLWTFMTGTYLNLVFADPWNYTNNHGETMMVRRTRNKRFNVLGMVSLTAIKSIQRTCFDGQPCLSDHTPLTDPFLQLTLPSTGPHPSGNISIPYNEFNGGYSFGIPVTASAEEEASFLKAYRPFFGPDLTAMSVQTVLMNPNGQGTVTTLTLTGALSAYGEVGFTVQIDTIPHEPLSGNVTLFLCVQLFLIYLVYRWFVRPYFLYSYSEPELICNDFKGHVAYLNWMKEWEHLARSGYGEVSEAYRALLAGLAGSGILWALYCVWYLQLSSASHFLSPGTSSWTNGITSRSRDARHQETNITQLLVDSVVGLEQYTPVLHTLKQINLLYSYFFLLETFVVAVMLWILIEHLRFQKRLSHMTDILKQVTSAIVGILILLTIVCGMIGIMCALSFGSLDPNFRSIWNSFLPVVESCLGLFRLQTDMTARSPPVFKYAEHIAVKGSNEFMPMLLMLFFKCTVFMFIFKLLLGIVMTAYRESRRGLHSATTWSQLRLMWMYGMQKYWHNRMRGRPFVRWDILCLALQCMESDEEDSPAWEKGFLCMDGCLNRLQQALNGAVEHVHALEQDAEASSSWQYPCLHVLGLKQDAFDLAEVEYVLKAYGVRRRGAISRLVEETMKTAQQEKYEELSKPMEDDWKKAAKEFGQDRGYELLKEISAELNAGFIARRKPTREEVSEAMRMFDVYCTGQVDFFFIEAFLDELGYTNIPLKQMHHLMLQYDGDGNMSLDGEELHTLTKDDACCGRKVGQRQQRVTMRKATNWGTCRKPTVMV